jgi:hypothetical protein
VNLQGWGEVYVQGANKGRYAIKTMPTSSTPAMLVIGCLPSTTCHSTAQPSPAQQSVTPESNAARYGLAGVAAHEEAVWVGHHPQRQQQLRLREVLQGPLQMRAPPLHK